MKNEKKWGFNKLVQDEIHLLGQDGILV